MASVAVARHAASNPFHPPWGHPRASPSVSIFGRQPHRLALLGVSLLPVVCLVLLLIPSPVRALPEGELAGRMPSEVLPYVQREFATGEMTGKGGIPIQYAFRPSPDGNNALVIVPGRTEFIAKYAELLYDLRDTGWAFFLLDHRGQGRSGRLLPGSRKGHVEEFGDYVADLDLFLNTIVRPAGYQRIILLSHSMGGTISILQAATRPDTVDGLILFAPMLGIETGFLPAAAARLIAAIAVGAGFGEWGVPGGGGNEPDLPYEGNRFTASLARFVVSQGLVAADPRLALGPPTYRWLREALLGAEAAGRKASRLSMPVVLVQAGADPVVDASAQQRFCEEAPRCERVVFEKARHEILMESDGIRDQALRLIRERLARFRDQEDFSSREP